MTTMKSLSYISAAGFFTGTVAQAEVSGPVVYVGRKSRAGHGGFCRNLGRRGGDVHDILRQPQSWRHSHSFFCKAGKGSAEAVAGQADGTEDWFIANDGLVRLLPLFAGALGGAAVVVNRALSGIAPVADAASAQSRADVICLALAATLLLNGLIWKSIQPKEPKPVQLDGVDGLLMDKSLPSVVADELLWSWDAVQATSRCRALVVVWRGVCVLQVGVAARAGGGDASSPARVEAEALLAGTSCRAVLTSGTANYMANLAFFPARVEFPFFPPNTQAIIVQPLGEDGVMLLATDTIRGFTPLDQAWAVALSEKLDISLQEWNMEGAMVPVEGSATLS